MHGRHAKELAIIEFIRERPDYLGWIVMVDSDTFVGQCSRSFASYQVQLITSGHPHRLGGDNITDGLWPEGATFGYTADAAADREQWGTGGIGVGDLRPWSEIIPDSNNNSSATANQGGTSQPET